jgi:hypothetical protein
MRRVNREKNFNASSRFGYGFQYTPTRARIENRFLSIQKKKEEEKDGHSKLEADKLGG